MKLAILGGGGFRVPLVYQALTAGQAGRWGWEPIPAILRRRPANSRQFDVPVRPEPGFVT